MDMKDAIWRELMQRRPNRRSLLQGLGVAAIGLTLTPLAGCGSQEKAGGGVDGAEEKRLNFYNWDTYIGETTLADFKKLSGIDVNMTLFASNDELFAKFKGGNQGYDVIVPSNDFVERMARANMLMPLDHAKIPNLANVSPEYLDVAYDPGRKFSVPYTWLVLGIGYRKSKMDGVPDSWKWLYDSDRYAGRIAITSEAGDLFRLGALYLGHKINAVTPEIVAQVEKMLIAQKKNIKKFHEDDGQDMLLSGEADIVMEWNGDIAQAMLEDDDLDFIIPKEGSQLNSDNLAIPKGAPHPENAHAFLNYILDAKAGAAISRTILYPTPNMAAKELMGDDYKKNRVIFPPVEALAKCEYSTFNPELQQVMEEAMTRLKAA